MGGIEFFFAAQYYLFSSEILSSIRIILLTFIILNLQHIIIFILLQFTSLFKL